jgi:ankyrin repeat protein
MEHILFPTNTLEVKGDYGFCGTSKNFHCFLENAVHTPKMSQLEGIVLQNTAFTAAERQLTPLTAAERQRRSRSRRTAEDVATAKEKDKLSKQITRAAETENEHTRRLQADALGHRVAHCNTVAEAAERFSSLIKACREGDIEIVHKYFADGFVKTTKRETPTSHIFVCALDAACSSAHYDVVRALLLNGVKVNCHRRCFHEYSCMQEAIRNGNIAIVHELIDHGYDVNDGWSLHLVCSEVLLVLEEPARFDIIRLLLESGARINAPGLNQRYSGKFDGPTCLWYAAAAGMLDLVRELIDRGANVDGIPDAKTSPLCPQNPLRIAASNGDLDTVRLLLQAGANPNPPYDRPNPPYDHVPILCFVSDIETMSELIAAGADVNAVEPLSGEVLLTGPPLPDAPTPSPRYSNPSLTCILTFSQVLLPPSPRNSNLTVPAFQFLAGRPYAPVVG